MVSAQVSRLFSSSTRKLEYCDLVEAVRTGKCRQRYSIGNVEPLDPEFSDRDWAVPSYDITGIFLHISPEDNQDFVSRSLNYISSGEFVLPHERFVLVVRDHGSLVVLYISQDLSVFTLNGKVRFQNPDHEIPNSKYLADKWAYNFKDKVWIRDVVIIGPNYAYFFQGEAQRQFSDESVTVCASKISGFLFMLSLRSQTEVIRLGPLPASSNLLSTNRGRALAKTALQRTPIPESQKVIYVSTEPLTKVVLTSANAIKGGKSKSPHDRMAHPRKCKGRDKPIMVSACKIHGGSDELPATTTVRTRTRPQKMPRPQSHVRQSRTGRTPG